MCSEDWSKRETPPQRSITRALSAAAARQAHLASSTPSTSLESVGSNSPSSSSFQRCTGQFAEQLPSTTRSLPCCPSSRSMTSRRSNLTKKLSYVHATVSDHGDPGECRSGARQRTLCGNCLDSLNQAEYLSTTAPDRLNFFFSRAVSPQPELLTLLSLPLRSPGSSPRCQCALGLLVGS